MIKLLFHPYNKKLTEHFCTEVLNVDKKELSNFRGNLNYGEHKKFQDWLFSQGIMLIQEKKALYLQFLDEHQALMFMMKWGVE